MNRLFSCDINFDESSPMLFLSFNPVNSKSPEEDYFDIEIENNENILSSFLQAVHAAISPGTPIQNYTTFASKCKQQNSGKCYVNQNDLNNVVDLYRQNRPSQTQGVDRSDFKPDVEPLNFFAVESVVINSELMLNEEILHKGTRINFYHKGRL